LRHPDFISGAHHTKFLDSANLFGDKCKPTPTAGASTGTSAAA
jgi:hypothetical protein